MKTVINQLLKLASHTIVIAFILMFLAGCKSCNKTPKTWRDYISVRHPNELGPDSTQLIVWRKPGTTDEEFAAWLNTMRNGKDVQISFFCKSCDSSIMLLTGPGAAIYASGVTPKGGNTTTTLPPSGEDGPVIYSLNYSMQIPVVSDTLPYTADQLKNSLKFTPQPTTEDTVIVAVMDTGLDTMAYKPTLYKGSVTSCLGIDAASGWSFASNDKNWRDDHGQRHGTVVTHLIVDQVHKYGKGAIKILPIKIHDQHGGTNLFKVLCAIAYASDRGANIVNASFGFYTARDAKASPDSVDKGAYLLKQFVKQHLTDKGILLVAAAGNVDDQHEDLVFQPAVDKKVKRNLDSVSFYPASLSRELDKVIPVTTLFNGRVSLFQNYSPRVVYVGVQADALAAGAQVFANPLIPGRSLNGSSFATPIVAGEICAHYRLLNRGNIARAALLDKLVGINVVKRDATAVDTVFNGFFTRK